MSGESVYEAARKALRRFVDDEHGYHGKVDPEAVEADYNLISEVIDSGEKAERERDEATVALTMIAEWVREEKARPTKRPGGQTCGDSSPRVLPSALIELERLTRIEDARYTYDGIGGLIQRADAAERERESIKKDRDETAEALSLAENRRKETTLELMKYTVRAETAEARVKELEAALGKMIDAVQWMSSSDDFVTDGKAHSGWVKIRDEKSQALKVWRPKS